MTNLPLAVHFVAQAPILDSIWIRTSIGGAHIGVLGARWRVAVFQQVGGVLYAAGAHIHAQHGYGADFIAEAQEFIGPKLIGLCGLPR